MNEAQSNHTDSIIIEDDAINELIGFDNSTTQQDMLGDESHNDDDLLLELEEICK